MSTAFACFFVACEFDCGSRIEDPDLWEKWISKLKAKGFFEGVSEGSNEYQERYAKAVSKFAERMEVSQYSQNILPKDNPPLCHCRVQRRQLRRHHLQTLRPKQIRSKLKVGALL